MGMSFRMFECCQSHFPPTDSLCYDKEIWDKICYNSACLRDICEILFSSVREFSEIGYQMLLTEFYPDRPLLP